MNQTSPLIKTVNPLSGHQGPTHNGVTPDKSCPPPKQVARRPENPYGIWPVAPDDFATSSDVLSHWRAAVLLTVYVFI